MEKQELEYGTKEYWQHELKDVEKVYVVGTNMSSGMWNRFKILYLKDGKLEKVHIRTINNNDKPIKDLPALWSKRYLEFTCSALGTSRILEVTMSLFYWLYGTDHENLIRANNHEFLSN